MEVTFRKLLTLFFGIFCLVRSQEQQGRIPPLIQIADRKVAELVKPASKQFVSCLNDSINRLNLPTPTGAHQAREQLFLLKDQVCPTVNSSIGNGEMLARWLKPLQDDLNADAPFEECKKIWHLVLLKLHAHNRSLQETTRIIAHYVVSNCSEGKIDEAYFFLQSCPALYRQLIEHVIHLVHGWVDSTNLSGRVPHISHYKHGLALNDESLVISACNDNEPFKLKICKYKSGWYAMAHEPLFCPDILHIQGETLITDSKDGTLTCTDLDEGRFIRQWQAHGLDRKSKKINAIASYDDEHVLTAGDDGTIARWHVATGDLVVRYQDQKKAVKALATLAGCIICGLDDGTVRFCNAKDVDSFQKLYKHKASVTHAAFLNDDMLVTSADNNLLYIFQCTNKFLKKVRLIVSQELNAPKNAAIGHMAIIAGNIIYSSTGDKTIRIFDPILHQYVQSFDASSVRSSFAINGSKIATYLGLDDIVIKQAADWRTVLLMSAWRQAKNNINTLELFSQSEAVNELAGHTSDDWQDTIEIKKKKLAQELLENKK